MRDQKIIRDRLKEVLRDRKSNQHTLAKQLDIEAHYLRRMLGEGKIQKERFDEICKILDISAGYLSGESDIKRGCWYSDKWLPEILEEIYEKIQEGYSVRLVNEKGDVIYESGLYQGKYAGAEIRQAK